MITAIQCKMARAALGWPLREVAERVGVNINTIIRFEDDGDPRSSIRDKIEQTFIKAGIVFSDDGDGVRVDRVRMAAAMDKEAA